jgi:hypothetical protein
MKTTLVWRLFRVFGRRRRLGIFEPNYEASAQSLSSGFQQVAADFLHLQLGRLE